jgi:hypothetical protein
MTAVGGFLGHVPRREDFRGDRQLLSSEIYRVFLGCSKQQLAFNTIADRVLNADLYWSTLVGVNEYEAKLPVDDYTYSVWVLFVRRLLQQLVLYGFALYRLVTLPPFTPVDLMSDHKDKKRKVTVPGPPRRRSRHPEVADGQEIGVEWDPKYHTWTFTHASGGEMTAKDGWNLLMFAEPHLVRPGNSVIYASMSANAYELSEKMRVMIERMQQRDRINSNISVLTQFSKYFGTNGSSTKPFIQPAVQSSMLSVPENVFSDVDEAIRNRAEVAMKIAKSTESMRKETYRAYEQTSRLEDRDIRSRKPLPKPVRHDEYMVTDAQDGTQADYLRAPESLEALLERFENGILFAFLIPPQALGKNISESLLVCAAVALLVCIVLVPTLTHTRFCFVSRFRAHCRVQPARGIGHRAVRRHDQDAPAAGSDCADAHEPRHFGRPHRPDLDSHPALHLGPLARHARAAAQTTHCGRTPRVRPRRPVQLP